jgi:hypothetical protein
MEDNSLHLEQIYPHPLPSMPPLTIQKLGESCFPKHKIMDIEYLSQFHISNNIIVGNVEIFRYTFSKGK